MFLLQVIKSVVGLIWPHIHTNEVDQQQVGLGETRRFLCARSGEYYRIQALLEYYNASEKRIHTFISSRLR